MIFRTSRARRPVRFTLKALLLAPAFFSPAQAATYDFSGSVASGVAQPFTVRAGVSDVLLGGNQLSLGVSNRAAEVGAERNQPLFTIGTVNLKLNAALVFAQPGVRLGASAGGTLGPVALSASGQFWSAPAAALDPLSVWNQVAPAVGPLGAQANLDAKYRVSRNLIATFSGQLGAQSRAALSGEWRAGAFSYRLGALGGVGVLGALAGATYRADTFTLSADALLGRSFGGTLTLDAPALIALNDEQAIDLSAYLAYEPWRSAALPLRYGLDADVPLGQAVDGHLSLGVRGGSGGLGVRAGYTFTPGAGASTQTPGAGTQTQTPGAGTPDQVPEVGSSDQPPELETTDPSAAPSSTDQSLPQLPMNQPPNQP
ncbi:hypothetical protein [Deinococcus rubellus]|uniref:Uncharacterized protein n=1 Tax=Deinococcus rubellus TaxID=1889240 RepID=A0ABY5YN62_9DEIO|nr:hypothetical protein [Deinococcus rubellus]UWX65517.1 hypothetical protein N0D28_07670 [Deinococcus rubellus]